ncbi:PIN domain-containing protein [Thermococcus sp. M36]|uniref:PIN domain-containing protein n=1 Tax=Thermococcus sp. M36 TaxID=1638261 RepID=UPI00143BF57E|nr:PIN domain-containing protein [Thermococcus sp. M36]NJE05700.1 PIN domain-containing protein [Thermococcus sp. M36]
MYLVDTNVFLEILLDQENADNAERFLRETPPSELAVSDFSVYSIGIILFRQKKHGVFREFVEDVLLRGGLSLLRLTPFDFESLVEASRKFHLDFDDAYQYTLARKYGLRIVSYDSDFDATDIGRVTPLQAMR